MSEPVVTDEPTASTPEPVLKAFAIYGSLATVVVTLLGVAVAIGVLSSDQASAINGVLDYVSTNFVSVGSAVVGVVSLVSGLVSGGVTAVVARRHVTPVRAQRVYRHEAR
jgi:hypothetical protein